MYVTHSSKIIKRLTEKATNTEENVRELSYELYDQRQPGNRSRLGITVSLYARQHEVAFCPKCVGKMKSPHLPFNVIIVACLILIC